MSQPIDDKPEEAIKPESISPAEDLGSAETKVSMALEKASSASLSQKQVEKFTELQLNKLDTQNKYVEAQTRYINAQAEVAEESAQEQRLKNKETKDLAPASRIASWVTFFVGIVITLGSTAAVFIDILEMIRGVDDSFNAVWLLPLSVGIVLSFGPKFIPQLISLLPRKGA